MAVLAHYGGADEMLYVLVPALVYFAVFRLVRGRSEPPDAEESGAPDGDTAQPTSPR